MVLQRAMQMVFPLVDGVRCGSQQPGSAHQNFNRFGIIEKPVDGSR